MLTFYLLTIEPWIIWFPSYSWKGSRTQNRLLSLISLRSVNYIQNYWDIVWHKILNLRRIKYYFCVKKRYLDCEYFNRISAKNMVSYFRNTEKWACLIVYPLFHWKKKIVFSFGLTINYQWHKQLIKQFYCEIFSEIGYW